MQERPFPRRAPWVWWALAGTFLACAAVWLWTDPVDDAALAPWSGRRDAQPLPRWHGPDGTNEAHPSRPSPSASWPWPGPAFAPASRDPFTFQSVKPGRNRPARLAAPPTVTGVPVDAAATMPSPAPPPHPRLRFLGRVLGHDGVASIYMADDSAGVAGPRSPDPVALGQVVGGGYRVVSVGDRQIGLAYPGSDTRVEIDLPDWPGVAPTEERSR
jgi:hypothetical protein